MNDTVQTDLPIKLTNLGFPEAVIRLREKKRLARAGWNDKNVFIFYFSPVASGMEMLTTEHGCFPLVPFFLLKTADGMITPWNPSQQDMLADDWCIVEGEADSVSQTALDISRFSIGILRNFHGQEVGEDMVVLVPSINDEVIFPEIGNRTYIDKIDNNKLIVHSEGKECKFLKCRFPSTNTYEVGSLSSILRKKMEEEPFDLVFGFLEKEMATFDIVGYITHDKKGEPKIVSNEQ